MTISSVAHVEHEHVELDEHNRICSICSGPFNIETEGGCEGDIDILPVAFCPTCRCGIFDFVQKQCLHCEERALEEQAAEEKEQSA